MFKQPYPFLYNKKRNLLIAFFVGVSIFLINFFINEESTVEKHFLLNRLTSALVFGGITVVFIWLVFDVIPALFFNEDIKEQWTLGREFTLLLGLFTLIIVANYIFLLISAKDLHKIFQLKTFLIVAIQGILIGFIPALIVVLVNYMLFLRTNLKQAQIYNAKLLKQANLQRQENIEKEVFISTNNKTETIRFLPSQLLFMKSYGNYIEVYTQNGDTLQKDIYRIPLQNIEESLKGYPHIKRTHRCYLANLRNVKKWKGNARNFQLFFADKKTMVPVSRNKFHEIQDYMTTN